MSEVKLVEPGRSHCPVARTLDLVGDRWSLLIVRDMLSGCAKFRQFLASPESIPTNVLSSRLKLLESSGLIKATLYQRHPPRFAYTLTDQGKKLASVISAIAEWGESSLPNPGAGDEPLRARRKQAKTSATGQGISQSRCDQDLIR
jgi:DNA-binding HxlR family transcriptional regulator